MSPSAGTPRTKQQLGKFSFYAGLFLFLFAVYLLTYTPRINASDGLAMFATAESLARHSTFDIEQIRWMGLQQGTYGLDGLLYSRKGIGVPVGLLPLVWTGVTVPWFGAVSASLLFNAIVTALTAVILMVYVSTLGFSRQAGLLVALTFGLATPAWPYAKSLFSDPFSGFLLLASAFSLLQLSKTINAGQWRIGGYAFLAGLLQGWNVATRYAEALFVPVFGLLLLHYLISTTTLRNRRQIMTAVIAFAAPLLLIGLGLIAFNLSRYGDPFNTGYLATETFSAIWIDGIIGQLASPGRGLLLFSPVLALSFVGTFSFLRHHRAEALLALSIILIHLLLYGKWFMWHGGYAWGPRFLIPTVPFWMLLLTPVVSKVVAVSSPADRTWQVIFGLLICVSLVPQLLAVSIDFAPFLNSLLDTDLPLFARETFFQWKYSPLIGAWRHISPEALDLAWAWESRINWSLVAVLVTNVVVTAANLWQANRSFALPVTDPSPETGPARNYSLFFVALLTTLTALISLLVYTHRLPPEGFRLAVSDINRFSQPGHTIITNNPEMTLPFAELYKGGATVLGLNHGGFPLPEDIEHRLDETIASHTHIWWLPNWLPPEESAIEQTLLADTVRVRQEDFDGQRLALFAPLPGLPPRQVGKTFDGKIILEKIAISPTATPGAALPLELQWQTTQPLIEDYRVFVHLLGPEGQMLAQADGQPAQWTRPTTSWSPGEIIVDRHGLWIPPDAGSGEVVLRVGFYQPTTNQRLLLPDGSDAVNLSLTIP